MNRLASGVPLALWAFNHLKCTPFFTSNEIFSDLEIEFTRTVEWHRIAVFPFIIHVPVAKRCGRQLRCHFRAMKPKPLVCARFLLFNRNDYILTLDSILKINRSPCTVRIVGAYRFDLGPGGLSRRCTVLSHVLSHRMEYFRLLYRILHTSRHRIGCGQFRQGNWVARRVRKTNFFGFVTVNWWQRFIFIVQCLWNLLHVP